MLRLWTQERWMTVICEICEIWIFSLLSCHCISGTEMQRGRSVQGCDNAITPTLPFAVLDGSWLCFNTFAISALHPFFSLHTILSSSASSIIFPSLFCSFQYSPPSMTTPHTLPFTHVLFSCWAILSALFETPSSLSQQLQRPLPFPKWEATCLCALPFC